MGGIDIHIEQAIPNAIQKETRPTLRVLSFSENKWKIAFPIVLNMMTPSINKPIDYLSIQGK